MKNIYFNLGINSINIFWASCTFYLTDFTELIIPYNQNSSYRHYQF